MTTMPYRRLGRSGVKVSALSLGSWVTYGNQVGVDAALECMTAAYDAGVNFFDNAEVYAKGQSELIMGEALAKAGWRRSSYLVSTKFYWGLHDGVNEKATLNRKYLLQGIDASLERLKLDYVDLVYCHRPDPETTIEETVHAMHDIVTSGRAVYWGTSEWSAEEIAQAWHVADRRNMHKPVTEQPQYNLFHRDRVEREYARLYRDVGLGDHDLEPARVGTADRQVQRRHPGGLARNDQGVRVARRARDRPGEARRRPAARADRARAGLHARAARDRLVPQEPERLVGDHRRFPGVADRREPEGDRRRGIAHARGHGAHRRGPRRAIAGLTARPRPDPRR